jgi:hypothetical protein
VDYNSRYDNYFRQRHGFDYGSKPAMPNLTPKQLKRLDKKSRQEQKKERNGNTAEA